MPTLPDILRAALAARGWSASELGRRCTPPLSPQAVSRIIAGVRGVSLDTATRLAEALGLTLDELAGRAPNGRPARR